MSGNKLLHVLILTLICVAIWRHLANMSYYNCPSHLSIWRSMDDMYASRCESCGVCVCSSGSKTLVGFVKKNTYIVRMTLTGRTCGTQCEPLPTHPPPPLTHTHTHAHTHHPSHQPHPRISQMWALLSAFRELAVDYNTLREVLYVFEHKTLYILTHISYVVRDLFPAGPISGKFVL